MDWITNEIAIGNYLEALDLDLLQREKLRSALSLDGTLYGKRPEDVGIERIETVRLEDAPGNELRLFRLAVATLGVLVKGAPPVLVQCHAGRSRSAVVVAGHLMLAHDMSSDKALELVAAKRQIAITAGVERLLDSL
jgi:protein-tyrosine phosphatase